MEGAGAQPVPNADPRRDLFDRVCLSCLTYLETFEECSLVTFTGHDKASDHDLDLWEKQSLPYQLPEDMKSFYRMFNGFNVKFMVEAGAATLPVGAMQLNNLKGIKRLPLEGQFPGIPDISGMTSAAFVLDDTMEDGNIVLLYRSAADREMCVISSRSKDKEQFKVGIGKSGSASNIIAMSTTTNKPSMSDAISPTSNPSASTNPDTTQAGYENPEIWFQDRSARWHFLSRTFSDFLRVMVVHLGIDGWAMAFTPEGVSAVTQQWMGVFNRERLCLDVSIKL
jgi:tubulin polyglutamylase complex subunit 2